MYGLYLGGLGFEYDEKPIEVNNAEINIKAEQILNQIIKTETSGGIILIPPLFAVNKYKKDYLFENVFDDDTSKIKHVLAFLFNDYEEENDDIFFLSTVSKQDFLERVSIRLNNEIFMQIFKNKSKILEKALIVYFLNQKKIKNAYKDKIFCVPTHDDLLIYNVNFYFKNISFKKPNTKETKLTDIKISSTLNKYLISYCSKNNITKTDVITAALS